MSKKKQSSGCRKMLRRTFLFLIGIALANFLAEYFSIAQNRSNFFTLVRQLWEKAIARWQASQDGVAQNPLPQGSITPAPLPSASTTPEPLPSAPLPSATVTPQPLPTATQPQASVTPKPKPSATPKVAIAPRKKGKPVQVSQKTVNGVAFYQTTIDLTDPETFITIGLANDSAFANTQTMSSGDEPFAKFVARNPAAVVANGTFFGKDDKKAVLGNIVAGGKFLKYSRWENYGTTLGISAGNKLEMITARAEGKPEWNQHWFSLTCGPRLLKQGKIWLSPLSEGFKDSHVLNAGYRTAIGFPANRQQLYLITFLASLTLQQEAQIMKDIGCIEAMNLDGGASVGLAHNGRILLPPGRNLTNVIVVYDTNYPAPADLKKSWQSFQDGDRPQYPG
jgi:exopolysaccharide biosynthesis protein